MAMGKKTQNQNSENWHSYSHCPDKVNPLLKFCEQIPYGLGVTAWRETLLQKSQHCLTGLQMHKSTI